MSAPTVASIIIAMSNELDTLSAQAERLYALTMEPMTGREREQLADEIWGLKHKAKDLGNTIEAAHSSLTNEGGL